MKRDFTVWQIFGFAATSLGGTLLHFLYGWTGDCILVAPFSAVNESTFEHAKILFVPMLVFAIIESRLFKEIKGFWGVKLFGISMGLILIPTLFYTYNGVFGSSPDWMNVLIFFVAAAAGFALETRLIGREESFCKYNRLGFLLLVVMAVLFAVFTFLPLEIPLFQRQAPTA